MKQHYVTPSSSCVAFYVESMILTASGEGPDNGKEIPFDPNPTNEPDAPQRIWGDVATEE